MSVVSITNYLLILAAFFIGSVTTYEDVRVGKIKNKWILLGLMIGVTAYLIYLIIGALSLESIFKIYLNAGLALLFGYIIWYFDWWSAGDAKLFFIFALLLPMEYYWRTELPYFPSFVILVNTFIPLLIYLFVQSVIFSLKSFFSSKAEKLNEKKSFSTAKIKQKLKSHGIEYLKSIIGFLLVFLIFQIVRTETGNYLSQFNWGQAVIFFLILLGANFLRKIFQKKWPLILISAGLAIYFVLRFLFLRGAWLDFFGLIGLIGGSVLFLTVFGLANWLVSSYLKSAKQKQLHFALWLFLGVILTIIFQGSLLRVIF